MARPPHERPQPRRLHGACPILAICVTATDETGSAAAGSARPCARVRPPYLTAADSREVRGDDNLIRPRLGQRDAGDSDLTRGCELDSGGGRRHHLLIMAPGEQAKRHVARALLLTEVAR